MLLKQKKQHAVMKKTYIIPAERVVNLDATDILAASTGVSNGDGLGNNQPKGEETTPNDDNQFVKSQSQWDNEW